MTLHCIVEVRFLKGNINHAHDEINKLKETLQDQQSLIKSKVTENDKQNKELAKYKARIAKLEKEMEWKQRVRPPWQYCLIR